MKLNQHHQQILSESDIIRGWLSGYDIRHGVFSDVDPINTYNKWCEYFETGPRIHADEEYTGTDYVEHCISNWNMPEEYVQLDIHKYLLDQCSTAEERDRVNMEYVEFDKRGLADVLRFLKYFRDVCRENNIVMGVGRGSSVASFCLFLLDIHRVNSLQYNLDLGEFLK